MAGLLSSLSRYVTVDDGAGGRCPAHFSLLSLHAAAQTPQDSGSGD